MINLKFKDNEYPYNGYKEIRKIVRAILFNEDMTKILLHHIYFDDIFGHRDYYETPGGGVNDNENYIDAIKRECLEECGLEIEVIKKVAKIIDFYNLINRKNINYYYICRVTSRKEKHLEEYEKEMFESSNWYSIDEAIDLYKNMDKEKIARLVQQREQPVMLAIKNVFVDRLNKKDYYK